MKSQTMDASMNESAVESTGPSTDKDVYAELCGVVNDISQPLANRKLAKKLYKLVKKAAADKSTMRQGVADVLKAMRKNEKGIMILAGLFCGLVTLFKINCWFFRKCFSYRYLQSHPSSL